MKVIEGQISLFDKPQIRFIRDCTRLNKDFVEGFIHTYNFIEEKNYILFYKGVWYGPLKEDCELV